MADSYHHGNLRQALIDAGIKLINENGEENLSLRKVAAACDVSHAAPYAHFKDKEELIDAIKENVTDLMRISRTRKNLSMRSRKMSPRGLWKSSLKPLRTSRQLMPRS